MSDDSNTLTLKPASYGKIGIIHCGVTREGFIAVGGDPRNIKDGEELTFDRAGIKARRAGSDYTFTKMK